MRRIVRPFIKEFKSNLSKSAPRARPLRDRSESPSKAPTLDPALIEPRRDKLEDSYRVALEAADAVFGRRDAATIPLPDPNAAPPPPRGRVLPSLVDQEDALAIRLKAAEQTRRGRKPGKPKIAGPVRRKTPTRPPQKKERPVFVVEEPAVTVVPEKELAPATRRKRRPIQERWVLRTELRPGEKWKRRFCKAAR
jgi:hypothetical protein